MYVRGYLQGSENGRVVTIGFDWKSEKPRTGWLGIRIICPSGTTCLPADCCFNELALKIQLGFCLVQSGPHHRTDFFTEQKVQMVSGHLGTEHMRHLGTRYWTSRYSVFLHVDVVYTNFYVFFVIIFN